jgi:hypothetical protein
VLDELATCCPSLLRELPPEQRRVVELINLGSLTSVSAARVGRDHRARVEVTGGTRGRAWRRC